MVKKKYLIFGGVVLVIVLTILLVNSSRGINIDNLSEIEKYALFRADTICKLSDYGTSNMWQGMAELEVLVYEYGYEPEEVEPLETKYSEDNQFWLLVMNYVKELCPDVYDRMISSND